MDPAKHLFLGVHDFYVILAIVICKLAVCVNKIHKCLCTHFANSSSSSTSSLLVVVQSLALGLIFSLLETATKTLRVTPTCLTRMMVKMLPATLL